MHKHAFENKQLPRVTKNYKIYIIFLDYHFVLYGFMKENHQA